MLFLYRPRETRMPFARPRGGTDQAAYNRRLQDKFDSTRRVTTAAALPPPPPSPSPPEPSPAQLRIDQLRQLADLHASGALSDDEFAQAKAKVLAQ